MPKFQLGDKVAIDMMAVDSSYETTKEGIKVKRDTRDKGTGIVVRIVPVEDHSPDEQDPATLYQVAVIDGYFDGHRNALGQLSCWESELLPFQD